MGQAHEWSEELIAESFELQGYLVLRNLPLSSTPTGGRNEADIIAFRLANSKGTPRVVGFHVEAAIDYQGTEALVKRVQKKFDTAAVSSVREEVVRRLGLAADSEVTLQKWFVDFTGNTRAQTLSDIRSKLSPSEIQFILLTEFMSMVDGWLGEWRERMKKTTTDPSLPQTFPLLNVVLACEYAWNPSGKGIQ